MIYVIKYQLFYLEYQKEKFFTIIYQHLFFLSSPLPPPSPAQRRTQRLPQCLIIGARKGGTRALLDALALHPQIRVARREVHFFNNNETYAKGIEWYRLQMPYTYAEQVKTKSIFETFKPPELTKFPLNIFR